MSPDADTAPPSLQPANCPVWQGEFIPRPRQIYYSPRCKSAAHRLPPAPPAAHICPACQGTFTVNPRLRQVYCSPNCRRDAEKQRNQARDEQRAIRLGEQARPAPAGGGVAFSDVPGDRVDARAGVPLQGSDGGMAGAGQQHRGGGAALGVVCQDTVA